ncbi:MCP four helix bundle domain-containing protein [Desulfosporosinus sp. Sb-LF]|uniref:MCP four helix bundle domain-containing protein n=1 Tax=Desulfosporosinus sp. Sb-LF TaxID=2560027 RepID=UPI00107FBB70|nr:MCP four helix bundle domain-containing protein [Desulfosporosinus sp. Sb-LF]TGE32217.1 hypothetical protein E4K68_14000 [Desulfosporosinus sp. Sb-LF]
MQTHSHVPMAKVNSEQAQTEFKSVQEDYRILRDNMINLINDGNYDEAGKVFEQALKTNDNGKIYFSTQCN